VPKFESLAVKLREYLDEEVVVQVHDAYKCAKKAHEGQARRSGEPYIIHPLAVSSILADLKMDPDTLMAALLHDVIEDTETTREELADRFGNAVADLVEGVSKLTQMEFKTREEAQAENFLKMTLAMSRDIRVILVKLADRLHNMRTLDALSTEKRHRIAKETLDIYAPIANRLGINSIRVELEDLSFAALYPMRSKYIQKAVEKLRGPHKHKLDDIKKELQQCLADQGLKGEITGREKHIHSIYQKMKLQKKSFYQLMDVYAFRIVTDTEDNCYRILGAMHKLYKPLPGRFKDYIAMPKTNGYQSLHTTLFGQHVNIEIQIRTRSMDELANHGIAAHWLYKSGASAEETARQIRVDHWVKGLMEMSAQTDDSMQFIEHVKIDLFPDSIYLFTPKGKIYELPKGATPIDFAYSVHTELGNTCVACRIDKQLAPLSVPLRTGQTVEVITSPGAKPTSSWLNFVTSGKAKMNIRHYLKVQKREEAIALGKRLLDKSLSSVGVTVADLPLEKVHKVVQHNNVEDFDAILESIGLGSRMSFIVARQLYPESGIQSTEELVDTPDHVNMTIEGAEGVVVKFATCCYPMPDDAIVGMIGEGQGLVVHAADCPQVLRSSDESSSWYNLNWAENINQDFPVKLKVQMEQGRHLIAELVRSVSMVDAIVNMAQVEEENPKLSTISLEIKVRGRTHLARVMRRLRNIKSVVSLNRETHR
jgi:RelA/SpoT family (p)ppGpp synthetase